MDLVLRHEARADLVADEVGEPLPNAQDQRRAEAQVID
jgi:hypothetical protein